MEEEEHEVYGAEIPDEGEMEGDLDLHHADVDMSTADDDAVKVLIKSLTFFFFGITAGLNPNRTETLARFVLIRKRISIELM